MSKGKSRLNKKGKKQLIQARDRPEKKGKKKNSLKQKRKQYFKKLSKIGWKRILSQNFPYFMCGWLGDRLACLYRTAETARTLDRVIIVVGNLSQVFTNPLPSLKPRDLLFGIGCGLALKIAIYRKGKNAKKYRHGVEYGSARWSA